MFLTILLLLMLVICTIEDLRFRRLTMNYILIFAGVGLLLQVYYREYSFLSVAGGIGLGLLVVLLSVLTEGKIGLGDGALLVVTGIYLGFQSNMELTILALLLAAVWSIATLIKKRRKDYEIPFVPFLLVSFMLLTGYEKFLL